MNPAAYYPAAIISSPEAFENCGKSISTVNGLPLFLGSLSNGNNSTSGSSYKSTIENKVKLMSQNHQNDTYVSNMHVRVPSQESSIYGDSRTYINLGQPVAMASKAGILLNPSNSQLNYANKGGTTKVPAIPRSQIVKTVVEPSYSSLLQNEGEQNQVNVIAIRDINIQKVWTSCSLRKPNESFFNISNILANWADLPNKL